MIPVSIAIALLVFLVLVIVPLLPAIKELFRPKDEKPLALNMNFSKDYRYFGKSFQKILEQGLGAKPITGPGDYALTLSKPERVRVVESEKAPDRKVTEELLYVLDSLSSGREAQFKKEVYVKGPCRIGDRNVLRALCSEGDLVIGEGSYVARWIDGDKDVEVKEGCRLGLSVACPGRLAVGRQCTFNRMFGLPIVTYATAVPEIPGEVKVRNISDTTMVITRKELIFPPMTQIPSDIVTHQKIVLRQRSSSKGNIKSYSEIVIEAGSRVEGNLFSEKDIVIGTGCTILGHVFSQGHVELGKGVQVGQKGQVKSVIAKKGIRVEGNVTLYGYLMTDGEGKIL